MKKQIPTNRPNTIFAALRPSHLAVVLSERFNFLHFDFLLKNRRDLIQRTLFILIGFFAYLLGISLHIHSLSLFLSWNGAQALPVMMVFVALAVILFAIVSSTIIERFSPTKFFVIILIIFSWLFAALFFINDQTFKISCYIFITNIFYIVMDLTVVRYISSFLSPLQARSFLPVVTSFSNLGIMVGSYLADKFQTLHEGVGIGSLPVIGMVVLLIMIIFVQRVSRKRMPVEKAPKANSASWADLKKSYTFIFRNSPLFKVVLVSTILLMGVQVFTEFKLKTVLAGSLSPSDLTSMFGLVYSIESAVLTIFNLFLLKRVLFRFGINNVLLFFPVVMSIFLLVALFFQLNYIAIIVFYLSFSIPFFSLVLISITQIFTLVPPQFGSTVYLITKGIFGSIFYLIFSVFLLIYSSNISLEGSLNTLIIGIFLILLFTSFIFIKKRYSQLIKENLFKEDEILKYHSIDLLAEKNQKEKGEVYLRRLLMQTNDETLKQKIITTLGYIGNFDSLIDLIEVLEKSPAKTQFIVIQAINSIIRSKKKLKKYPVAKHKLIQTFQTMLIQNVPHYIKIEIISSLKYFELEDILKFLEDHLHDSDIDIQTNVIETMSHFEERAIISYLRPLLASENPRTVGAVIVALWKFKELRLELTTKLAAIITKVWNQEISPEIALYVIGEIGAKWELHFVNQQLESTKFRVHTYALLTLIKLGEKKAIVQLANVILQLSAEKNYNELEFIFSQYRKLKLEVKLSLLQQIQTAEPEKIQQVATAFEQSKYLFDLELSQLT